MTQEQMKMKTSKHVEVSKVIPYSDIKFMSVARVDEKGADGKPTGNKVLKFGITVQVSGDTQEGKDIKEWIKAVNSKRIVTVVTNKDTGEQELLPNGDYRLTFYHSLKDGKIPVAAMDQTGQTLDTFPRFDSRDGDSGQARFDITLKQASNGSLYFQGGKAIQLKNLNINLDGEYKNSKKGQTSSDSPKISALEALIEAEERGL